MNLLEKLESVVNELDIHSNGRRRLENIIEELATHSIDNPDIIVAGRTMGYNMWNGLTDCYVVLENESIYEKVGDNLYKDVTRFEVIDHNGRSYVSNSVKITPSLQDAGKTLKMFVESDKNK